MFPGICWLCNQKRKAKQGSEIQKNLAKEIPACHASSLEQSRRRMCKESKRRCSRNKAPRQHPETS
jgi:hypothetical protein